MIHKHNWFPGITLLLSLVLVGLIIFSMMTKAPSVQKSTQTGPTVSESAYQTDMQKTVQTFLTSFSGATSDTERTAAVQSALDALLRMRVPADDKDLHLELAISLQNMKERLAAGKDASDGLAQFKTAAASSSWLHL